MNKEEFINLINTLEFEELSSAKISYYKNKPKKNMYGYEEEQERKTICIGQDIEHLINEEHKRNVEMLENMWQHIYKLEEKNNEINDK